MENGIERRRHKRLPIKLQLSVNKVFKQDYIVINNIDAEISVFNISKTGIGFVCKAELPLNYYFDGKIILHEESFFYAVIHIVRVSHGEDGENNYGAEFIGLAPFLANKIDEYEKSLSED